MIEIFNVNGVRVANIKTLSDIAFFGIVLLGGSNYETPETAGIAHYTEHCMFKGTSTRNWNQLNQEFAKLGANNNAYTSNSEVLYYTTCPKENIPSIIDLMLDMFFNSTFPKSEIEKERQVIKEEKKMYQDDPKYAFNINMTESFFKWNIGHDTIGTFETINSINRKQIIQYLNRVISLENFILICSGDVDSKLLRKCIEKGIPKKHDYLKSTSRNHIEGDFWTDIIKCPNRIKLLVERENITQSNVSMLAPGISIEDPDYHALSIAIKCLGGGSFSKLNTRIREEMGLCYAVGMTNYPVDYPNRTITELWGYTSPENVEKFMDESEKVLRKVIKSGIDQDTFDCAKISYLASIFRTLETSEGKAMFMSRKLLFYGEGQIEDAVNKVKKITLKKCNEMVEKFIKTQYNWAVMNPKT